MLLIYNFLVKNLKSVGLAALSALLLLSFTYTDLSSTILFKASTLVNVKHAPFDGLVYPYKYAADWVNLNGTERELAFGDIPSSKLLSPIRYNASELAVPLENLGFSNSDDLRKRNAKITYSVPYMGNYKLDGLEGAGSHAAVDVKLPMGTPILAIGNGVVTKVDNQEWGFGKHIVVRHNDFPDFENPGKTTTYFSSYSHLDRTDVAVGTVVYKGQQIGLSGESGTASTPHLHFQIDRADAPWNPYWPFTATEASEAGLDFFAAVNAGIGKENGRKYTISPMLYVQAHLSSVGNSIAVNPVQPVAPVAVVPLVPGSTVLTPTPSVVNPGGQLSVDLASSLDVVTPSVMILGNTYNVQVKYAASDSAMASLSSTDLVFKSNLIADYSVPKYLDLNAGELNIPFEPRELGNMNLSVKAGNAAVNSKNIEVRLFSDLENQDKDLRSIKYLRDKGVVKGYEDLSFKPNGVINKAEAAKLIVEALPKGMVKNVSLPNLSFNDVSKSDWFYEYVQILAGLGAVDKSLENFNPSKEINLAEYLKLLYASLQADLDPNVHETYATYFDTKAWYSPFLQLAMQQSTIGSDEASRVSESLKRRDVARITAKVLREVENN